jgi:hypothetical protein
VRDPELARRQPVRRAEEPAEVGRVAEPPPATDLADRPVGLRGVGQVAAAPLEPAVADVRGDGRLLAPEQLVQVGQGRGSGR